MSPIEPDKIVHFVISFFMALLDPVLALWAGVGKEIYDLLGFGVAELGDLLANWLGILAAMGVS